MAAMPPYLSQSNVEMSHPQVTATHAQGVFAPAATNESEEAGLIPNLSHSARDFPSEKPRYLPTGHSLPRLVISRDDVPESETPGNHGFLDLSSDEADTCMPDRESEDDLRPSTVSQLTQASLRLQVGHAYKVSGSTTHLSLNRRAGNASSDVSQPQTIAIYNVAIL